MFIEIKNDRERLDIIIRSTGLNVENFTQSVGLTQSEILHRILRAEAPISHELAKRINSHYPTFDIDWILTGTKTADNKHL